MLFTPKITADVYIFSNNFYDLYVNEQLSDKSSAWVSPTFYDNILTDFMHVSAAPAVTIKFVCSN